MSSEDCDALGLSPSNNQIQKSGAGLACQDNESLPASDLERSKDLIRQSASLRPSSGQWGARQPEVKYFYEHPVGVERKTRIIIVI